MTADSNATVVAPRSGAGSLDLLLDVSLPIIIEVGRARSTVQEVLRFEVGSVVPLDRRVGEPVDVYVSDRRVAEGEVVVVGERLGVRITALVAPQGEGETR
ncbi:MAG: flagellar motor switch protein FliN [Candidatus Eisenbacteria bacterium]|uniref:Flagellar motor switch protein FliN n=1 Tax=Eiseniibacteriota bacterium TaxID=2212470 RepID=A0A849SW57_UNCEI|nr:flagellar motor switch protein FliN [Candidatus Eisenbacteria bacterium]